MSDDPESAKARVGAPARKAAFALGISAESRAAAYLVSRGHRIIARRFRTPVGEIDIIASRRNMILFVEVKARATLDDAAYAITPQQQRRIVAAAEYFLANYPVDPKTAMRFDALLVAPGAAPRHLMSAFEVNS